MLTVTGGDLAAQIPPCRHLLQAAEGTGAGLGRSCFPHPQELDQTLQELFCAMSTCSVLGWASPKTCPSVVSLSSTGCKDKHPKMRDGRGIKS